MSKLTEIVENIKSKLSIKTVLYIVIGLFLFKSCQSCNRANTIERNNKTHIVVVDSLTKRIDSLTTENDSLKTEIEKRDLVIKGKNETNSVQIENSEFYQYKINTLNEKISELTDTITEKGRQIKQLQSTIRRKNEEITNLNNRLNVEK